MIIVRLICAGPSPHELERCLASSKALVLFVEINSVQTIIAIRSRRWD